MQRLRFEHPEVRAVVIKSGKDNVFCAGANIRMLGKATHGHKVNFCKFTNETRLAIEDACANSGQAYLAAVRGILRRRRLRARARCRPHHAGGRPPLHRVAAGDAACSACCPAPAGLTRVTDKRKVRRDRADVFCATEEGLRGTKAVEWRLVDEVVPNSKWAETVATRARELAARSDRPRGAKGIKLTAARTPAEWRRASSIPTSPSRSTGRAASPP